MNVLITGGAGFIGAHTANELLSAGHTVRALDSLIPQVHSNARERPAYLPRDVELIVGDVRDPEAVSNALQGIDAVIHLAALVGVGQSMYQIAEYVDVNNSGTAVLLETLASNPVECLIVASSMSVYGEGLYRNRLGELTEAQPRTLAQLKRGVWEPLDDKGQPLTPLPTPEHKRPSLASIYALSKYDQERMCLLVGAAYGMRATALRLFNTYGPFQALSNPYTGVLSNFASRVLNNRAPLIYEDGLQQRDFVSVYDVARAFRMTLDSPAASGEVINISSGTPLAVSEAARRTIRAIGSQTLEPENTGRYRMGDIRHCFADITAARELLGWEPLVSLEKGLEDLAQWLQGQTAIDRAVEARSELAVRGLML